ncbi:MBL fold metallo-hydrolase [Streptomyces sp. NPDC048527]|uniref:MBL fold metallo-hydrolase n=1 Tax=Streptomyces sp. NPDC048527 TaxID=3365568 RepID=UPI0037214D2B
MRRDHLPLATQGDAITARTAVTRIALSRHLIEIGGRTFLTDPWFSTRPGHYQGEPIAIGIPDLPRLDCVLISHEHYDHCDLDAFVAYLDRGETVPLLVAATVVDAARKHGVYEATFVLRAISDAVYFAGDTMLIPELAEIPKRLGHISLAPLPANGLRIRPANNLQVVMNADTTPRSR